MTPQPQRPEARHRGGPESGCEGDFSPASFRSEAFAEDLSLEDSPEAPARDGSPWQDRTPLVSVALTSLLGLFGL
jgi:hypothetical protein